MPDGVQKHDDGWIRHDGGRCPVHPMDVVDVSDGAWHTIVPGRAGIIDWRNWNRYRPLRDEDGVPYCSAEGLEPWSEYVATDRFWAWQFDGKPEASEIQWCLGLASELKSAPYHENTRDHWTNTLRRVYRWEDA